MIRLKDLSYAAVAMFLMFSACEKTEQREVEKVKKNGPVENNKTLWTDFMSDGFSTGWLAANEHGGSWWLQTATGINWAIINNPTGNKSRAEYRRPLFYYTSTSDYSVIVKGKFKMETTADGNKPNEGGWIMQTMAYKFKDPRDSFVYKPLVIARMLPDRLDYLVYDYTWNASLKQYVPTTTQRTILSAPMAGRTVELALTINFSKTGTGSVMPNLDGVNITSAAYNGPTYPSIFPANNQMIQWSGGCYSSYPGEHYAKIGVFYLYNNISNYNLSW